jgi:hypothetical protein
LLSGRAAAAILGVDIALLRRWRQRRIGPPWVRLTDERCAPIRYREADLIDYIVARVVQTDRMARPLPGPVRGATYRPRREREPVESAPTAS